MNEDQKSNFLTMPTAIVIAAVMISISILVSGGVIKLKGFGGKSALVSPSPTVAGTATQAEEEDLRPVLVSLDDDPVLGDKNAPLTIVEFSDYECPFCKRHFDQTYTQIVKDYIEKGRVKLVYRDLPLPFHDPMATLEAQAANCAREQGGDSVYFKYHDEIFKRTKSNGNGLNKDDLYKIAEDLGLSQSNLKTCMDSEKYKDEVQKDLSDAQKYGATGTPTFFIGKSSSNNEIEGTKIVGAQPYTVFKNIIDNLLK